MFSTRKMPVRINEKKHTTFAGEHLIPSLTDSPSTGFVSAKTGKTYSRGAVVYLGKDVTPEMITPKDVLNVTGDLCYYSYRRSAH